MKKVAVQRWDRASGAGVYEAFLEKGRKGEECFGGRRQVEGGGEKVALVGEDLERIPGEVCGTDDCPLKKGGRYLERFRKVGLEQPKKKGPPLAEIERGGQGV